MIRPVRYLTVGDLVRFTAIFPDGPYDVRDAGLLALAAERPQLQVLGRDAYPDLPRKAAALLHSIVRTRPLVDGNERTALLAALAMLHLNGTGVAATSARAGLALTRDVAEGTLDDVPEIAARLTRLVERGVSD
ncbi:type II toxin-antitoxin system death-on-curing family toxin [Kineococcus rhizosphaerae]|uniref:Death-on-curing protein n=1 Tax=Kineococcus rhizosphaerae TaxID=559628 RepID=A0A2T0R9X4_9ACTN|nr:Fic family protein [Kineococcus rhizosphaerae]PRY17954.1 death-on-curing protein [Kineococcus rhizosphaerae]